MLKLTRLGNRDFKVLFSRGRRLESPLFRIILRENGLSAFRFAFVAPKASEKSSVARNRLRRRAREVVRQAELAHLPKDIAFFFKKEAAKAEKKYFYEELKKNLGRALAA